MTISTLNYNISKISKLTYFQHMRNSHVDHDQIMKEERE